MSDANGPAALDLFCGCGGMSWGLEQRGFRILAGIDNNPVALATFARNHRRARAFERNLAALSPEEWLDDAGVEPGEIDCIIGGPPCQGFSKNVPRRERFLDDPRNLLVMRYLEFIRVIRPKVLIMENVAEMVRAFDGAFTREILALLAEWGYHADVKVINAATLGVPQVRRRAFFFASQVKPVAFPAETHCPADELHPLFDDRQPYVTVWEAIGDLPDLRHGEGDSPAEYKLEPFTDYQRRMRQNAAQLHNHVARPLQPRQYARLATLGPGEGSADLPDHLKPQSHYSGAYGRLRKDMVARTITRWMFHPGSGRFGHPVDIRTITPREGARLQSFPDDFVFEGTYNQISAQIGNAVPPLIMERFAPILLDHLNGRSKQRPYRQDHTR